MLPIQKRPKTRFFPPQRTPLTDHMEAVGRPVTERIFVLEITHRYIIQSNLNYNGPSPKQTHLSRQKSAYRLASQVQGNVQLMSNIAVKGGGWVMVVSRVGADLSLKTRQETKL